MSMMYQSQVPAFSALSQYSSCVVTDSTPDSPPSFQPVNIRLACDTKKAVTSNLPKVCCHCSNPLSPPSCFLERKDGDIYCYCFAAGGCCKSQIIFKAPNLEVFLQPLLAHQLRFQCMKNFVRSPHRSQNKSKNPLGILVSCPLNNYT